MTCGRNQMTWTRPAFIGACLGLLLQACDGGSGGGPTSEIDGGMRPPRDGRADQDPDAGDVDASPPCQGAQCNPCTPGTQGCECNADDCEGDLTCMANLCVAPSCVPGSDGCPCDAGKCEGDSLCTKGLCEACKANKVGCACDASGCRNGLVCDKSECRQAIDCQTLLGMGLCDADQVCTEATSGHDAVCEDCVGLSCMPPIPNCRQGSELANECLSKLQKCIEGADGARCGDCLASSKPVEGRCELTDACQGRCTAEQFCDLTAVGGPACITSACPPGKAQNQVTRECDVTCGRTCASEGLTGRYWPLADLSGSCLCETANDYFLGSARGAGAEKCDADGDHWVRDAMRAPLIGGDAGERDLALAQNARCRVRRADRIVLVDEYGVRSTVYSCALGLQQDLPCDNDANVDNSIVPLRLLESTRNDVQAKLDSNNQLVWNGGVRPLAGQLNGLTKACALTTSDFDDDRTADVAQVQRVLEDQTLMGEQARLSAFAFFSELYHTDWEIKPGEEYGALVIQERSRCKTESLGFILEDVHEAPHAEGFHPDDGSTYWRSCYRRAAPGFDPKKQVVGHDFARFSPQVVPGPAHKEALPQSSEQGLIRNHGLCQLAGQPPKDGMFRGMHHHTQFQCVQRVTALHPDDTRVPVAAQRVVSTADSDASRFNRCAPDPMSTATTHFECALEPAAADSEALAWHLEGYRPYHHVTGEDKAHNPQVSTSVPQVYQGGCISEDAEWPYLCPSPEFGYLAEPPRDAFGRYRCHGWDSLFLWAQDEGDARRADLTWAPEADGELNMSVWAPTTDAEQKP